MMLFVVFSGYALMGPAERYSGWWQKRLGRNLFPSPINL